MTSAIYEGWVRHRRTTPKAHDFTYQVFMPYLRLDELPQLLDQSWLWSARRPALARFKRADFLGNPELPLDEAVRQRVQEETGQRPSGPIYMLANPDARNLKLHQFMSVFTNPSLCFEAVVIRCQKLEASPVYVCVHKSKSMFRSCCYQMPET